MQYEASLFSYIREAVEETNKGNFNAAYEAAALARQNAKSDTDILLLYDLVSWINEKILEANK